MSVIPWSCPQREAEEEADRDSQPGAGHPRHQGKVAPPVGLTSLLELRMFVTTYNQLLPNAVWVSPQLR